MKNICVYIRQHADYREEIEAARSAGFRVAHVRTAVARNDIVVPRYSFLPFARELEIDVEALGAKLVSSSAGLRAVADLANVCSVLGSLTPRTWSNWAALPEGRYVVKGLTNSRKHQWDRLMFAQSLADVQRIARSLLDDPTFQEQGLVVREYVPLRTFTIGLNGLPITNEWRIFFYKGEVLAGGYYWATHPEHEWADHEVAGEEGRAPVPPEALALAKKAANLLYTQTPATFFTVDVAEKESGGWVVIEANDGTMAGLSMIPPGVFYRNLYQAIQRDQET